MMYEIVTLCCSVMGLVSQDVHRRAGEAFPDNTNAFECMFLMWFQG